MQACVKSELDLFAQKNIQTSILDSTVGSYKSISPVGDSVLEFVIPKTSEYYRDLSSAYLMVEVKLVGDRIQKDPNVPTSTDEKIGSINGLLHSLFSQINIQLNGKNITYNSDLYPYRAYIESLLNYSNEAVTTHLTTSLFFLDNDKEFGATDANSGWVKRKNALKKTVQLYGRLHADIFNTHLLLAYNNELRIRLTRAIPAFTILSTHADSKMKFQIVDATLYMRHVTPSPSVLLAHSKVLAAGGTFKYHINRVDLRSHTISANETAINLDNLVSGELPKFIAITFVNNQAFSGTSNTNPFFFHHYNFNFLCLKIDGRQVPSEALTPNWSEDRFARVYQTLFTETHIKHGAQSNVITPELFKSGYMIACFDLSPDSDISNQHSSLSRTSTVRLNVHFQTALPHPITCLVYSLYDSTIEIDQTGNVFTDY